MNLGKNGNSLEILFTHKIMCIIERCVRARHNDRRMSHKYVNRNEPGSILDTTGLHLCVRK